MQARYLTAYSRSPRTLVQNIKKYFNDLGAVYDNNFRVNPANKYSTDPPFASIFENYDRVNVIDKIGEARELRNRVMHGKYLTEGNLRTIQVICSQLHRFLVQKGHVGDFHERQLISR